MASSHGRCPLCKKNHLLKRLPDFRWMTNAERHIEAKRGVCLNCLAEKHTRPECTSLHRCNVCKGRHHTMIHQASTSRSSSQECILRPLPDFQKSRTWTSPSSKKPIPMFRSTCLCSLKSLVEYETQRMMSCQSIPVPADGNSLLQLPSRFFGRMKASWIYRRYETLWTDDDNFW